MNQSESFYDYTETNKINKRIEASIFVLFLILIGEGHSRVSVINLVGWLSCFIVWFSAYLNVSTTFFFLVKKIIIKMTLESLFNLLYNLTTTMCCRTNHILKTLK